MKITCSKIPNIENFTVSKRGNFPGQIDRIKCYATSEPDPRNGALGSARPFGAMRHFGQPKHARLSRAKLKKNDDHSCLRRFEYRSQVPGKMAGTIDRIIGGDQRLRLSCNLV